MYPDPDPAPYAVDHASKSDSPLTYKEMPPDPTLKYIVTTDASDLHETVS